MRKGPTSAIRFRTVEAAPCERIPGGTVREQVCVPWLDQSIGIIVSRPLDKPPDPLSWGRVRTLWYFVPTDPGSTILQCDTIIEEIRKRVRDRFRGIYDRRNAPRGTRIASGDDCVIETMVLEWSGMLDAWEAWDQADRHSFYSEVLRYCPSAILKSREWEGGGPGLSGTWFSVHSMHPEQLREEIASGIKDLMDEEANRLAKTQDSPPGGKKPRKK